MAPFPLHAKPAVLRCGRCGTFVDWEDAQLQTVCACRPRLELPPVLMRAAEPQDRPAVRDLFERDFGRRVLTAFDQVAEIDDVPVIVAQMRGEMAGALAYRLSEEALRILALATEPLWQRTGVGGYLLAEAELVARQASCTRMVFCTSNDNVPALYFYQRRGYRIAEVKPGFFEEHPRARQAAGFAGIPMRDAIWLQKTLAPLPEARVPAARAD